MHKKVVGGFVHPDEKGIAFPPAQALEKGIKGNLIWAEIPVHTRVQNKETQR